MGFDIECIVDIHTYPGEYFCPVCRTLVYPSEAVQSQCTHLYCKQCLLHVANGTRACPYDGYLVTEADSKPLVQSDKVLAENIGKVKVHCLFFRSGCTWEGALSECDAHCLVCTFGNSPVICNRCGVQIVHRQVHEHAQSCPGAYEAQQAVAAAAGSNTAPPTTSAEMNQPTVQAPNGQVVAATPVSASSQTTIVSGANVTASSQPAVVSGATAEQWYQQQYQQYYQQYQSYQPYTTQPYYQVQQQAYQQYPQQPVPVQVQSQPAVNTQPAAAPQTQLMSQIPQQPHFLPQAQVQGQPLPQQQMPSQAQAQNYPANHPLPNPPPRPPAQIHPQSAPTPTLVQAASHPQATGIQAAGQHTQMPQYQQHPPPQGYTQPQMNHPQPLGQPPPISQPANQSHVQMQQAQMYQSQSFPRPPHQPIHANGPASQLQVPHPPVHPAGVHHSYQHPMHAGLSQQHPGYPNPSSGSAQVPQQPVQMRPPSGVGSLPQTQPPALGQNQVPGISPAQQQQFQSHAQQPVHSFQGRPAMQPMQQSVPHQYPQKQPGNASFQAHAHQQGQLALRPYGPHHSQSQNYAGKPTMQNSGMHPSGDVLDSGQVHPQSKQTSVTQINGESVKLVHYSMTQAPKSSSDGPSDKALEESVKKEVGQTSGEKLFEAGRQDETMLKQEGSENLDVTSPKAVTGGGVAEPGSSAEGNKAAPKLNASLPQWHQGPGKVPQMNASGDRRGNIGRPSQQLPEINFGPQHLVRPTGGVMLRDQRPYGSGPLSQPYGNELDFARTNGGPRPEHSMDLRGEKRKNFGMENLDPFPSGQTLPLNQSLGYDAISKMNSGGLGPESRFLRPPVGPSHAGNFGPGPEFGQHHKKHLGLRSPDREYLGISPHVHGGSSIFPRGNLSHRFGEGSRSFNPSSDPGNPFHDGRFPPLAGGDLRRGNIDGPGNLRFGDHMTPGLLHNHNRRPEFQDGPGPIRGDAAIPGGFSIRDRMAEFGTGNFNGMRNSFPVQGPPNAAHFAGGMDPFDMSRKRRSMSAGWCRICKIDCETVEGLDMHSQTGEHQKMTMDMVKTIKLQNKEQHRSSGVHNTHDGGRSRKVGPMYRGNKP